MSLIVILLYLIFLICIGLVSFFIVFHLKRYSINQKRTKSLIIIFILITILLVLINAVLFFSIPFDDVARSSLSF